MSIVNDLTGYRVSSELAGYLANAFGYANSVKRFGAIGNGRTDDTAAIQLAYDEAHDKGLGNVWFPPGNYIIEDGITCYSNVSSFGTGNGSTIQSQLDLGSDTSLLNYVGTSTTSTTLTANTTLGSRILTVASTANFSANTYIYLVQSDTWAMLHKIKSIDSATQITLYETVGFAWLNGDTVLNGNWVANATIQNLRFLGRSDLSNFQADTRYEDHAINVQKAHHVSVIGCSFKNLCSRAIIFIDKASYCKAIGNTAEGCLDRAIESHAKTNGNILSGNSVFGGLIGMSAQGIGTVCSNNVCSGQYGFDEPGTERGSGMQVATAFGASIVGNTCTGAFREGMAVGGEVYETQISGNVISRSKRDGMTVNGARINITGNTFTGNGNTLEDAAISLGTTDRVNIEGNYFQAVSTPTTRAVYSATAQTNLTIGANYYYNYPGSELNLHASTTFIASKIQSAGILKDIAVV